MDIKKGKFIIPNIFTLTSLFLGIFAIISTFDEDGFRKSALAIFFAILCDMVDGRVARMTKTQTRFGIQLDSLSDFISFGVAPAVLIYRVALNNFFIGEIDIGIVLSFLYSACGAMRLARFNIIAEKNCGGGKYYLGLPIPMAGGTIASLVLSSIQTNYLIFTHITFTSLILVSLSFLMISTIKYKSFKKVHWNNNSIGVVIILLLFLFILGIKTTYAFSLLAIFFSYVVFGFLLYIYKFILAIFSSKKEAKEKVDL